MLTKSLILPLDISFYLTCKQEYLREGSDPHCYLIPWYSSKLDPSSTIFKAICKFLNILQLSHYDTPTNENYLIICLRLYIKQYSINTIYSVCTVFLQISNYTPTELFKPLLLNISKSCTSVLIPKEDE